MKTTFYFKTILLFFALAIVSCGDDDNGDGDGPAITSIIISSDETSLDVNETFTFTVTANDDSNVTTASTIMVNGDEISGNTFMTEVAGTYSVKATNGNLTSNTISITVNATEDPITSVTLSVDEDSLNLGETFTFSVVANNGEDVTDTATVSIDGTDITGNTFTPTAAGTFEVVATYEDLTSNTISVTAITITSVTLSADESSLSLGNTFTFTVIGDTSQDVTDASTFTVDGVAISGNTFTPSAIGTFEVVAMYDGLTSNTISVEVTEAPLVFTKNVLIEDYTGTWCGWCPRVAYGIEQVEEDTEQAVVVAIHRGNTDPSDGYYDPYNFSAGALEDLIGLTGYPTAMLNRTTTWNYPEPSNVAQVVGLTGDDADLGVAINSTLTANNISVDIKVKFGNDYSGTDLKLVVYLLEDDLIFNQTNSTSYYSSANPIVNFEHDNVLRSSLTNLIGDAIPSANTSQGAEYTKNFALDMPSNIEDSSKVTVVAFVTSGNAAINSREALVGETQDYEMN